MIFWIAPETTQKFKNRNTYKWHEFDEAEQVVLEIFCRPAYNCTANQNIQKDEQTGQRDWKHKNVGWWNMVGLSLGKVTVWIILLHCFYKKFLKTA